MWQYNQSNKPFNFKKLIILVVLISLLVGGVTGGVAGFILGNLQKSAPDWLVDWRGGNKSLPSEKPIKEKIITTEEESATIKSVEKVSPAVVSIAITKDLSKIYNLSGPNIFPFDDFFEFGAPFGFTLPREQVPEGERQVGGGTGFIIDSDGLILTNRHVVSDEEASYTVITSDGESYEAEVLAKDTVLDIAVVKIDAQDLPAVTLGDSDVLQIGQTVIAIGNTLSEYQNTVTKGVVSGVGRTVKAGDGRGLSEIIEEAIQTDAAINPGNSGGPLINLQGEVIGINTAISGAGQLIGFAIPINSAKKQIISIKEHGKIIRPFLGVRYILLNEQIAKANNLEIDYGALIIRGRSESDLAIIPGSPADKAGLRENDIILKVNGQRIEQERNLAKEISRYQPEEEIELKVWSKGEEKTIKVKLEEFKTENQR